MGQCSGGTIYEISTGKIIYAMEGEMLDDAYFINEIYDREIDPLLVGGGGAGLPGDGTVGGNSNTDGTINNLNPNDPDINYANGDFIYPNDTVYRTDMHTQWEFGDNGYMFELNTCVPHSIATCMQILEYKKRGMAYKFSHGWVWGNRDGFSDMNYKYSEIGMMYIDSLNAIKNIGICLLDTLPYCWLYQKSSEPSMYPVFDWAAHPSPRAGEGNAVQAIYSATLPECSHFKFDAWSSIGRTNIATMKAYITGYGCGMLSLSDTKEMWNAETNDGIVIYSSATVINGYGHSMCIRGWKKIGLKDYWICQNSWQTYTGGLMGHNGFFFIPMDYPRLSELFALTPMLPTTAFAWSTPITVGGKASILADDWNKLNDRLMGSLYWRGITYAKPIKYIKKGELFTAKIFNDLNSNIGQLTTTGIATKVARNPVLASDLNTLVSKCNSI